MIPNPQKTILLVEDDAILRLVGVKNLEQMGYDIHTADTGEAAVELANTTPAIDLILMDIDLGRGIDGTEAAIQILRKRDIPIVFLSSHTEKEVVEKTEKITSYGYVVKNTGITVLDASVKMAFKLFDAKQTAKAIEENLRTHQVELEMQNEELIFKQDELQALEEKYFNLYELALVGYLTLDKAGIITDANLTSANLFGMTKSLLMNHPFTKFITTKDQDLYYLHCKNILQFSPNDWEVPHIKSANQIKSNQIKSNQA